MTSLNRPRDKQIIDLKNGRLTLEWDAYLARLEALVGSVSDGLDGATGGGGQSLWVPWVEMTPDTTVATSKIAPGNLFVNVGLFDPATFEAAFFTLKMPRNWDKGSFTFEAVWSHAATVTNFDVVWQLVILAVSDGDVLTTTLVDGTFVTDTGGVTDTQYISTESSPLSFSAPAPADGDVVYFRIGRIAFLPADTLAIDARLHGVMIHYTTNALNEA